MNLNHRIRLRRKELGLSQEELAAMLGYNSRSTIAKIEVGENDIAQSKIAAFAKALRTTPGWLLGLDDGNSPNMPLLPVSNSDDEQDIEDMIADLKKRLGTPGVKFKGKPITQEQASALISGMQITLEIAIQHNKNRGKE